ncbi:peptide chain release factor H [Ruminococcaceae bacterium OttesenSCG-928-A16]|nr:peptide chain release factor H [Ruminococcaceae bacterium OttesenSCG-928-A16]
MVLQLSSGSGPAECELAVAKLAASLCAEFPGCRIDRKTPGQKLGCYRSVQIAFISDVSFLGGSVQWICQSPFRPSHRRKNWFVDVSVCQVAAPAAYALADVRLETFRSGGKGGQHVNKVETGVRAVHVSTGAAAVSTTTRSQQENKNPALERLNAQLAKQNAGLVQDAGAHNRMEHYRIQRGNPVRVYRGMDFKLDTKP